MIKKAISICLAVLMVLSVSVFLSGCSKAVDMYKNIVSEEKETGKSVKPGVKDEKNQEDINQSVKDMMNEMLDKSDEDFSEEERDVINSMYDLFNKLGE
ncbi:MAG: hypothetical protein ACOX3H_06985 [Saccharofermentanales bacterium]